MDDNAPAKTDEPAKERSTARRVRPHRSIEDNYPEYLEHEYGYAYEVADVMSQAAIRRHEELLHAGVDELEALDPASLDDFQRWAVARSWRRHGRVERFRETCHALLASSTDDEHPVVIYSEISRWLAEELIAAEKYDEARKVLDDHLDRWPSDVQAKELLGILEVLVHNNTDRDARGDSGGGSESRQAEQSGALLETLAEEYPADAELRFEIAEDLWRFGKAEAAKMWLERARQVAARVGDEAAMVDIELLGARMNNAG